MDKGKEYVYYDFITDTIKVCEVWVIDKKGFESNIGIARLVPLTLLDGKTVLEPNLIIGEL